VIREHFFSVNNACSINFKSLRLNKESICAYACCQDPACNFYKFQGSLNGNVKMFLNRIGYRHSINFKKSTQCRAVNSYLFKIEIKGSTAFEFRNKLIYLASTNRALIGNDQMINKHFPITGILYQGRTRKRILIKIPLRGPNTVTFSKNRFFFLLNQ